VSESNKRHCAGILVPTVIPIYCVLVCCGLRFVVVLAVFTYATLKIHNVM